MTELGLFVGAEAQYLKTFSLSLLGDKGVTKGFLWCRELQTSKLQFNRKQQKQGESHLYLEPNYDKC